VRPTTRLDLDLTGELVLGYALQAVTCIVIGWLLVSGICGDLGRAQVLDAVPWLQKPFSVAAQEGDRTGSHLIRIIHPRQVAEARGQRQRRQSCVPVGSAGTATGRAIRTVSWECRWSAE